MLDFIFILGLSIHLVDDLVSSGNIGNKLSSVMMRVGHGSHRVSIVLYLGQDKKVDAISYYIVVFCYDLYIH